MIIYRPSLEKIKFNDSKQYMLTKNKLMDDILLVLRNQEKAAVKN
jgi:hypothetical protein